VLYLKSIFFSVSIIRKPVVLKEEGCQNC